MTDFALFHIRQDYLLFSPVLEKTCLTPQHKSNTSVISTLAIAFAEAVGLSQRRWSIRRRSGG
jgi:hypothetical protein